MRGYFIIITIEWAVVAQMEATGLRIKRVGRCANTAGVPLSLECFYSFECHLRDDEDEGHHMIVKEIDMNHSDVSNTV